MNTRVALFLLLSLIHLARGVSDAEITVHGTNFRVIFTIIIAGFLFFIVISFMMFGFFGGVGWAGEGSMEILKEEYSRGMIVDDGDDSDDESAETPSGDTKAEPLTQSGDSVSIPIGEYGLPDSLMIIENPTTPLPEPDALLVISDTPPSPARPQPETQKFGNKPQPPPATARPTPATKIEPPKPTDTKSAAGSNIESAPLEDDTSQFDHRPMFALQNALRERKTQSVIKKKAV